MDLKFWQQLALHRAEWEKGLFPLSVLFLPERGCVLVILQSPGDREDCYHCHRYFQVGSNWACSADGQRVTIGTVFSWLNNPCAESMKHEVVAKFPKRRLS
jgi:hypothetical protein